MKSPKFSADLTELYRQATYLHQIGQLPEAAGLFRKILQASPKHFESLTELGTICLKQGMIDEGLKLLDKSLKINPKQDSALCHRGIAYMFTKQFDEAVRNFEQTIKLNSGFIEAHYNLGNALKELQRFEAARNSYDNAIALNPNFGPAYNNRGVVLRELELFEDALASFQQAIKLNPDNAEAFNNMGLVLQDMHQYEAALENYNRAILLRPNYANAYYNKGYSLHNLARFDEATASYDRAIALIPDHASSLSNKGQVAILKGRYLEGWRLYEWRWKSPNYIKHREFTQPFWHGDESVSGKTVLIYPEQGFGDSIQFCRYAAMLVALGAKVILETRVGLTAILSTLKCEVDIIEQGNKLPEFDFYCPIMSLPYAFKTTVETIPATVPYLYADIDKQKVWQERLGTKTTFRVGLAWSGRTTHKNDHNRSIAFKVIEPLLALPIEFHILQNEIRPDEVAFLSDIDNLYFHQDQLNDFSDTAALANEMDLVISVDTSIAHLAGALAKQLWILLPYVPDYRWLLDRTDCPWYPTATLFRQPAIGDWAGVMTEVKNKLKTLAV